MSRGRMAALGGKPALSKAPGWAIKLVELGELAAAGRDLAVHACVALDIRSI